VETLFYKYQGTGNDFVVLDGREWTDVPSQEWIQRICHRKWGVGSDGLVIVRPSLENDFAAMDHAALLHFTMIISMQPK
jgi:diaminopimelate epimerase